MKYLLIALMTVASVSTASAQESNGVFGEVEGLDYGTNAVAPIDGCRSLCSDSFATNSAQCSAYIRDRDYRACLDAANRIYYACLSRCRN